MPQFELGRALLIGVGEYMQADLAQVAQTVNEAQSIGEALRQPEVAGYPTDRVRVMRNAEAKRDAVIGTLEELAARTRPDETVFLYLASHGALGEDGEYYFATHDVQLTPNRTIVKDSGLSASRLRELLSKIQAQKMLVLINTCFSGEVTGTLSSQEGTPPSRSFNYQILATGSGRAIITASRATQASFFDKVGQAYTYFGRAVLDAILGKDIKTHSRYIGLFEFYTAVYDGVVNALKGTDYKQEPELTLSKAVGAFPIALYQGGKLGALDASAIQQSPPADKAVDVVNKEIIEAIHELEIKASGADAVALGKMFDFTGAEIQGGVHIGKVAGRDIVEITTSITNGAVAATDQSKLLEEMDRLVEQVKHLEAPPDKRAQVKAAASDLEVAREAGAEGDKETLLQRLTSAQSIMVALTEAVPVSFKLGEAIGTVLQRALVLWG